MYTEYFKLSASCEGTASGCYNVKVVVKHRLYTFVLSGFALSYIGIVQFVGNDTLLQEVYFCQVWARDAADTANVEIFIIINSNILA